MIEKRRKLCNVFIDLEKGLQEGVEVDLKKALQ